MGGKRNLARLLVARIEKIPHDCYAEPFIGMGGVFFRRREKPRAEAINDLNGDVHNLFRIVQRHVDALLEELRWMLASRELFDLVRHQNPATLTDVERAARFFVWQSLGFGGRPGSGSFAAAPVQAKVFNPAIVMKRLRQAHRRLVGVTIERLPYDEFVRRYDRPRTLFYLDPPYWGAERLYGQGLFQRDDFERLAELLGGLQGRFLLTLGDRLEIRRLFRRFRIEAVRHTYRTRGAAVPARELIITGGGRR
ncbi:MAG: DNA adenine methylase [Alphaproteobacteria bacterium]